jgi:integrase
MANTRRDRGEGSLYFDEVRQLYVGVLSLGKKPDGTRWRATVYGANKSECRDRMRTAREEAVKHTPQGAKQPLGEFLDAWLKIRREAAMNPSTDHIYSNNVDRFLKPILGAVPLSDLTPTHVHQMFDSMRDVGNSEHARAEAHKTLRTALSYAVYPLRAITYNPAKGIKAPKAQAKPKLTWTAEQLGAFYSALKGEWHEVYFVIAGMTGMRPGEILGLQWSDIDFQTAELHVSHTLLEVRGKLLGRAPTKTTTSDRKIPLGPVVMSALRAQRARLMAAGLAACPWVVPSRQGTPVFKANLARVLDRVIQRAGLSRITPHGFRHTHATLALSSGEDAKVISMRLGHSDIRVTLGTYHNPSAEIQREVSNRFETMITESKSG